MSAHYEEFQATKDKTGKVRIQGSSNEYEFNRGQFKSFLAKLSKAYADAEGDHTAMDAILESFIGHFQITDPLAVRNLQAQSTDVIERLYAADPDIATALKSFRRARYLLRHREILREWHAEADRKG